MINVGFKRLTDTAILPTKAHATDSGFDLYADKRTIITPEATEIISTGIAVVLPPGYEATIRPRSGITAKTNLRVQLGTIDNDYRGELGVITDNNTPLWYDEDGEIVVENCFLTIRNEPITTLHELLPVSSYVVEKGDKIAQLVVTKLPEAVAYEITGDLGDTDRGASGFGSTGVTVAC